MLFLMRRYLLNIFVRTCVKGVACAFFIISLISHIKCIDSYFFNYLRIAHQLQFFFFLFCHEQVC